MVRFRYVYVDSSVILRRTFQQPAALPLIDFEVAIASELIDVEVFRTIDSRRSTLKLSHQQRLLLETTARSNMRGIDLIPLDREVLQRASASFPLPLGTLDAIHLSTALNWADRVDRSLIFLTHDRQLAACARACGLGVYPEAMAETV
jgi:predicted nucleic acid-binding protein